MRLINADSPKEYVEGWLHTDEYYHPYSKKKTIPISELYDVFSRIPTVDAIPVEVIETHKKIWESRKEKGHFSDRITNGIMAYAAGIILEEFQMNKSLAGEQ